MPILESIGFFYYVKKLLKAEFMHFYKLNV